MVNIEELREKSIISYLEKSGVKIEKIRGKHRCSSPFSSDSNPSFYIYPENRFYDFSTGKYGNIIDLVMEMTGKSFKEAVEHLEGGNISKAPTYSKPKKKKKFSLSSYLCDTPDKNVIAYAKGRGITRNFVCSKFYEMIDGDPVERKGMGFIHYDKDLKPCGIKIRKIVNEDPRFTARGKQMYYIVSNINHEVLLHRDVEEMFWLYVVESESSANSVFEFLDRNRIPCVVVSFGSVSSCPEDLPKGFIEYCEDSFLIIDYDGNNNLYQERIKKYEHLKLTPKKIILEKGEDLNYLYAKKTINRVSQIILP